MSLTINDMPTHLPHFRTFVRVPCAVALRILAGQAGRVLGQILHLAGLGVSGGQARVFLVPPLALLWRFSQDLGLANPCVEVRRNFTDEGLLPLVEPIEKLAIATVELIKRPCLHCDAVEDRLVDQHQGDLWLGQKLDFVRDMSFFRRSGSSAQSSGRYVRAAIKHWKVAVANDRATLTTAFSTLPRLPLYCRLTPTVSFPALAVPVSLITPIASGSACSATTSLRQRLSYLIHWARPTPDVECGELESLSLVQVGDLDPSPNKRGFRCSGSPVIVDQVTRCTEGTSQLLRRRITHDQYLIRHGTLAHAPPKSEMWMIERQYCRSWELHTQIPCYPHV